MHHVFTTIEALLHYAQNAPDTLGKGVYLAGYVTEALAVTIKQVSGLELANYRITLDHSAITHALRQHGQPKEVLRGQLPLLPDDIITLANRIDSPTQVQDAGQLAGQLRCLRFEFANSGARTIAVLEVRTGRNRQQLALKTLYKKRPAA